jgi:hypothetical protein
MRAVFAPTEPLPWLVVGMDKVLTRQRLVALEAGGELDILVGRLVRRKGLRSFGGHSRLLCHLLTSPPRSRALRPAQSGFPDASEISRGKTDRLGRTPAGFTTPALDGRGFRDQLLARPVGQPPYPVLVHRAATLLHASLRPRLATTPLRFANPSPPSGWTEDFHLQAVVHARHTAKSPGRTMTRALYETTRATALGRPLFQLVR